MQTVETTMSSPNSTNAVLCAVFFYKNGVQVRDGDVCFYSEDDGSNEWHYANSLCRIIERNGELHSQTFFYTQDDGYTLKPLTDYDDAVPIKHCVGVGGGDVLKDFTKVGTVNNEMLFDEKYVNDKYARK